jgi:serine/threonine protein kinase
MFANILQILKGIQHLRDQGKALSTLNHEEILFTESGAVKIGE